MKKKASKKGRKYFTVPMILMEDSNKHNMAHILGYIRLCKNREGIANPSHKNIAKHVGISEKSVRTHLTKAKEKGWIDWESRKGSHESNSYTFPASSDWLEDEYLADEITGFENPSSVTVITEEEPSSVKSSSVNSNSSSVNFEPSSVNFEPSSVTAITDKYTNIENIKNREEPPSQKPLIPKPTVKENKEEPVTEKKTSIQWQLLTLWAGLYRQAYSEVYVPSKGRDLTIISELLEYLNPEELKGKMEQAFIQLKPKDGKVTLPYFKACINNLSDSTPQSDTGDLKITPEQMAEDRRKTDEYLKKLERERFQRTPGEMNRVQKEYIRKHPEDEFAKNLYREFLSKHPEFKSGDAM